jgi:hypothetical protein
MDLSELMKVGVSERVSLSAGRVREPPDYSTRVGDVCSKGEVNSLLQVLCEPASEF